MSYGLPRGRAALLLRIALLHGLFGPHLFQLAHVFGFHAHKNATTGPLKASHFSDTLHKTNLATDNTDDTDSHGSSNHFNTRSAPVIVHA